MADSFLVYAGSTARLEHRGDREQAHRSESQGPGARKRIGVPYRFCQLIVPHQWFPVGLE
ncbi:MAG TPA: hypothetical protein VIK39_02760 [Candidatus Angelobacter sp.]